MSRRRLERAPETEQPKGDRPTIESVLDLWSVPYTYRMSQMIRCPLHEDRTPSCSVNLDKQLWNCKSCGEKGDVWTLIEKKEGVDFLGARAYAAAQSLTEGDAGGSGGVVRVDDQRRGRTLSAGTRTDRGDRSYTPSWRRRRSDSGS